MPRAPVTASWELPLVRKAINTDELLVAGGLGPLLQLPVAVKHNMPAKLRASIQSILVNLKNSEAGKQVLKSARFDRAWEKAKTGTYDPQSQDRACGDGPADFGAAF